MTDNNVDVVLLRIGNDNIRFMDMDDPDLKLIIDAFDTTF